MRYLSPLILILALPVIMFAQSPHGDELKYDCALCHNAESWKINSKDPMKFDHKVTDYPLTGQHAKITCRQCHQSLIFSEATSECASCHTDMHQQTVGMDCARCHTTNSWLVENVTSLHQLSRFPLLGAHITADCQDCHPSASMLLFEPLEVECYDCHESDYTSATNPNHIEANYSISCTDCHSMNAFTWTGVGINHDFFPLTQGHAINDCKACHAGSDYSQTSSDCFDCHQEDYMTTNNPNHIDAAISTACATCHTTNPGWKPAEYRDHDAQYFPVYSGSHAGEWISCAECHTNSSNYTEFSCISCHEHNQGETDDEHNEVGGYIYNSQACFECHPTGEGEGGFNHNLSNFPLTGAHITTDCIECHSNGYTGTTTVCSDCHNEDYNQTSNPNHFVNAISTDCALCHSTLPEWKPAAFPNHNEYYVLAGAHTIIANDCNACHAGDYNNTPNSCFGCHEEDYNQTTEPPHATYQFSNDCQVCHTEEAWVPSTFNHDIQYFPIYSGKHSGEWGACIDCHINPGNIAEFSCIDCHEHNQPNTDDEHQGIGGYFYNSQACYECHPTGEATGSFDHNLSNFPLTGAHITTPCLSCHASGYTGTTTICSDCHIEDFNQSVNPSHPALGIPIACETCHNTNPGWQPATFPIHSNYYPLEGEHAIIANDCAACHEGNYTSTPNNCFECHEEEYNQASNPNHLTAQFPTTCEDCHNPNGWTPASFNHDEQYFPIYSGEHQGEWDQCSDCHTNPNNYSIFDCLVCHEQGETDDKHQGIGGYIYNSNACFECHPDGSATGSFNHNNTIFPLTGGHLAVECIECHATGYTGTTTICSECHDDDYTTSTNPNHMAIGIPNTCETCHTTNPGWQPATFPIHNNYWVFQGAHVNISNECDLCHFGNYTSTPNTCFGCHEDDYNQTTDPDHQIAQFPTDCEVCHTQFAWVPSTFDHDNQYFPIYSGSHEGEWDQCSDCHPNPANYEIFDCLSCHEQAETDEEHDEVPGYQYNSQACYNCHPNGNAANKSFRRF